MFRAEVLRRIYNKYLKPGGKITAKLTGDIDLNWTTIARLAELSYRCTLCRRCATVCPIGVDNGLINHEIRKLFSQEMGIAPKELHDKGTVQHLRVGSSTGMNPLAAKDSIEFIQEEMEEITGYKVEIPWDVEGADILLLHNAGEMLAWPENVGAFAIIFQAAGLSWTLSSEAAGYDAVNYGLWYDDVQFSRVAVRHADIARRLKVKKIVMGECGHAHKALTVIADRLLTGDLNIPRESALVTLEEIVLSGKLKFDPRQERFSRHPARSLQRGAGHGDRRAPAAHPQKDRPAIPGNDASWRGELLLRRRVRLCHHVGIQFYRVEKSGQLPQEVPADPRRLSRRTPGGPEIRLRPLLELQRRHPGHHQLLPRGGAQPSVLRRPGRTDRQCHGRYEETDHPIRRRTVMEIMREEQAS